MTTGEVVGIALAAVASVGAAVKIAAGWVAGRVDKAEAAKDEAHARELAASRAENDRLRDEITEERERSERLAGELLDAYRLAHTGDSSHEED